MKKRIAIQGQYAFFFMTVALLLLSLGALCLGRYNLSAKEALTILLSPVFHFQKNWTDTMGRVVFEVRLPRILSALVVGAALSISGAVYQSIFKNPLVSPDLLGVSSGASVGAAISILVGEAAGGIQVGALCGGLVAVLLATAVPKLMRNDSTLILVLAGIIVQGFMTATMGLIKYIADPESQLAEITYWQMGSISNTSMTDVSKVLPAMLVASGILIGIRWQINILSLGDREAGALGINIRLIRGLAVACSTILTACAVCISGVVGWIGLIIPHMCRMLVGPDNTKVMPMSLLVGATFMLLVDTLARTVSSTEIPLSIITGFVGAPVYVWLLFKQRVKLK